MRTRLAIKPHRKKRQKQTKKTTTQTRERKQLWKSLERRKTEQNSDSKRQKKERKRKKKCTRFKQPKPSIKETNPITNHLSKELTQFREKNKTKMDPESPEQVKGRALC